MKIVPETEKEGMEWMRKLAKYTNVKFPSVELLTNLTGAMNQLRWVGGKFESLSAFCRFCDYERIDWFCHLGTSPLTHRNVSGL